MDIDPLFVCLVVVENHECHVFQDELSTGGP